MQRQEEIWKSNTECDNEKRNIAFLFPSLSLSLLSFLFFLILDSSPRYRVSIKNRVIAIKKKSGGSFKKKKHIAFSGMMIFLENREGEIEREEEGTWLRRVRDRRSLHAKHISREIASTGVSVARFLSKVGQLHR